MINKNTHLIMKRGLEVEFADLFAKASLLQARQLKKLARQHYINARKAQRDAIINVINGLFGQNDFFGECQLVTTNAHSLFVSCPHGVEISFNKMRCSIKTFDNDDLMAHTMFCLRDKTPVQSEIYDEEYASSEEHERRVVFIRTNVHVFDKLIARVYEIQHQDEIDKVRDSIVALLCIKKFATSCLDEVPLVLIHLIARMCWRNK